MSRTLRVSEGRVCNKTGHAFQVLGRAGAKSQRREEFPGPERGWRFQYDGSTRRAHFGSESGGDTCAGAETCQAGGGGVASGPRATVCGTQVRS